MFDPDTLLAFSQRVYTARRNGLKIIVSVPRQKAHVIGEERHDDVKVDSGLDKIVESFRGLWLLGDQSNQPSTVALHMYLDLPVFTPVYPALNVYSVIWLLTICIDCRLFLDTI